MMIYWMIYLKKNIETATYQIDFNQLWLTCVTHDPKYKIVECKSKQIRKSNFNQPNIKGPK